MKTQERVSGERMAATVAALAGAAFTGRRVGSAGGAAARAWLAERLAEAGAEVTVEPFVVPHLPDVYATPAAQWSGELWRSAGRWGYTWRRPTNRRPGAARSRSPGRAIRPGAGSSCRAG
ncbi:hypothetical protein ACPPVO_37510 [Dactylosporangium sp. McL0621]|uniref:hypothetical protein n=1 Tax=Dactylosporangium sp. McL0621 TaxID=3415678 RepID=UPI003CEC2188